ncbi:MAG: Ig-like domain-containing protein, partial [Candidatus Hadarchaeales archaeon]
MTGGERHKTGWFHGARELGMRALAILLSLSIFTSNLVLVSAASPPPGQPSLLSPPNGAYLNDNTPTFEWTPGVGADYHRLLVDNDPDFSSPIYDNSFLTGNTLTLPSENALPDGTYYWKVVAVSGGGENSSESWSFTVDTLPPPFVNLLFPPDNGILRESRPTFGWGRVADSGGVSYSLLVDNDPGCGTPELHKENLTENFYTPAENESLSAGRWYWRVLARDGAGNVSSSDIWSFFLDFSPPYATDWRITKVIGGEESLFPFAEGEYTNDNTPFLTFRLMDDASGVADNLEVLLDENGVSFTYYPENGWVEHQVPPENALTEGTHTVKVRVWDNLGNYAEISRSFRVDLTPPPRVPLRSPEDYSSLNDPTPLFRWYDVPDNQVEYTLEVDDNLDFSPPIFRATLTATEFELPPENALPLDGWYYWRVGARDGGGNESFSEVWRFLLDTIPPPPPSLLSPENGEIIGENTPLFTWSSVPDAVRYRLQLSPNPLFSPLLYDNSNLTETRDNFATHPENALPEGVYYWRVGAFDNVGNLAWSQVRWFRVDLYPPEAAPVPLTPFNGIHTNNRTPTFSWTPVEDPAGVTYQLHLSMDENFSEPTIVENLVETSYTFGTPFQDGTYYWRACARDNAGNQAWSGSWSFTVDTSP